MDKYVAKPIDMEYMMRLIRELIARKPAVMGTEAGKSRSPQ